MQHALCPYRMWVSRISNSSKHCGRREETENLNLSLTQLSCMVIDSIRTKYPIDYIIDRSVYTTFILFFDFTCRLIWFFFSKNHNWDNAVLSLFVVWVRLSIRIISLELFCIIFVFFFSRILVWVCVCAMRISVTYGYPFENCDYKIELNENEGMSVINPGGYLSLLGLIGYYGYFKPGSSCRYTVRTPPNYAVKIQCDIDIAVTVGACSGVFGKCQ